MDNTINVTKKLLSFKGLKFTSKYLKDEILSHPHYNSLLAITDVLEKYKIETLAVKIDIEKLIEMPLPSIIQVEINGVSMFFVLANVAEYEVSYYNDKNRLVTIYKNEFVKIWTGACLLVETTIESKEPNLEKKLHNKNTLKIFTISTFILLILWVVYNFINSEAISSVLLTLTIASYTILKIIGLITGIFLLWFEIDQYNPKLQSFCTGGGASSKVNCNAVLGSKYAKLFKGSLSLSLFVFSYFFSTLIYLLINKFSASSLSTLGFFSFVSFPIIITSIYYQAFVIKQWCKFCIVIQIVILSEIAIAFLSESHKAINVFELPLLGALFLIPIIGWKFIHPLLENQKEINLHKRSLKKLKNNPNVLETLLFKSRKIETSNEGLGISINNENAKYHIIKVCNPYCSPCAKAHPVLEDLVNAGKINLQVLFTAKSSEDKMGKPVSHFLAIDEQGDKKKTQKALDDWYHSEEKDYEVYANKYPINEELKKQNSKIEAMRAWCDAEKITHTPTIFINGYELPKEYSIEDLTEVLK